MRFRDQIAFVAGGQRGIGDACVDLLRREGAEVHVIDLHATPSLDICDSEALQGYIDLLPTCPSLVVNAVGNAELALIIDQDVSTFRKIVDIELVGPFNIIQASARRMIRDSVAGSIVNISSVNGQYPSRGLSSHCSSKAGLNQLTKCAAIELGEHGIRVNAVAPGCTLTPLTAPFASLPGYLAHVSAGTPLADRLGEPAEIADAIAFLLSADSRWVTGHNLNVDGGMNMVSVPDPYNAASNADPAEFSSQVFG